MQKAMARKCLGMLSAVLMLVSVTGVSLMGAAAEPAENLLDNMTVTGAGSELCTVDAANHSIVVPKPTGASDQIVYFNGVTLDASKTYEYSFTFRMGSGGGQYPSYRFPVRTTGYTSGQWMEFRLSDNQIRLTTDYWGNNDLAYASYTFAADTDYAIKIVTAPTSLAVYINETLIVEKTDYAAYENAQIGFGAYDAHNYSLTNLSLVEQKATSENLLDGFTIEWDESKYEVDAATNSITVDEQGDHYITYKDVTLDKNGIYEYSFTFNMTGTSTAIRMPLRVDKVNDSTAAGHWVSVWIDGFNQLRLGENYTGDPFKGLGTVEILPNTDYTFTYVLEPQKVTAYVNGSKIAETTEELALVENGLLGFGGYGMAKYTMKNISLIKTGEAGDPVDQAAVDNVKALIAAIGEVTEESGPAIQAAREAYDALNSAEKALVDNYTVLTDAEAAYTQLKASSDYRYYALYREDLMGNNYWTSNVSQAELPGGGVRFSFKDSGTNMRVGINRAVKLDGLHMELTNLTVESGGLIAFYFADYDGAEGYTQLFYTQGAKYGPVVLVLDTVTGQLKCVTVDFSRPDEENQYDGTVETHVLATDEALKAANLTGKTFSLRMEKTGDDYTVSVAGVEGVITKAMFDLNNKLTDPDNAYITLTTFTGEGDAMNTLSFDILSVHGGQNTCADSLTDEECDAVDAVIEKIALIGAVTEESGPAIEAAEDAYGALSDTQKGLVTNYNTLVAARLLFDRLSDPNAFQDPNYYSITVDDLMGTNHWPSVLTYENVTGGGVHFNWFRGGTDYRMGVNRAMKFDGLHLVFDNLEFTSQNKSFAIYLADLFDHGWAEQYSQLAEGPLALVIDTAMGQVRVVTNEDRAGKVIISDPSLMYETLSQTAFDVGITANDDGTYTLKVLDATGIITQDMLAAATNLTDFDNVYLTVCPWDQSAQTNVSFDLLSLHGGQVVCADEMTDEMRKELEATIQAIENIFNEEGKIDETAGPRIEAAWAAYDELSSELQPLVPNMADLETADIVYVVVESIEGLGTITLDSADDIEAVRTEYKLLGPDRRPLVGNYDKLNAAIFRLYELQKEQAIANMHKDPGGDNPTDPADPSVPGTGENAGILYGMMAAAVAAAIAAAVVLSLRRKSAERRG